MQNHTQIRDDLLLEIISRRWAKLQFQKWPSGAVQAAALQSVGISVDERTITGWRRGQLPSNRHTIQLIRSGYGPLLESAFSPAAAVGRLTELEEKLEIEKAALRAAEQELSELRKAIHGEAVPDSRGTLRRRGEGAPLEIRKPGSRRPAPAGGQI